MRLAYGFAIPTFPAEFTRPYAVPQLCRSQHVALLRKERYGAALNMHLGMSVGCMQPSRTAAASHANNWRQMRPMLLHGHQRPDEGLHGARTQHCRPLRLHADAHAIRLVTMIWCSVGAHDTASASKTLQQICQREINSRTQRSRIQLAIGLPAKHSALLPFSTTMSCIIHYTFRENKVSLDAPPRSTQKGQPPLHAFSRRNGKYRGRRRYVRWIRAAAGMVRARRACGQIDYGCRAQVLGSPQRAARMQ